MSRLNRYQLVKKTIIVFVLVFIISIFSVVALAADDPESQRHELAQKYKNAEPGESFFSWSYYFPLITRIFNDGITID